MASMPELESLLSSDYLICHLCKKALNQPVILPCLHSYCSPCLQRHLDNTLDDGGQRGERTVECPRCKHKTTVDKKNVKTLQQNYFLESLIGLSQCHQDIARPCDYCSYAQKSCDATSLCMECQDAMCEGCADAHRRTKITRSHTVAPYEQIQLGKYDSAIRENQNVPCPQHTEDEIVSLYCTKCDQLICRTCKFLSHEKHTCSDLELAGRTFNTQTSAMITSLRAKMPGLEQYIRYVQEYRTTVKNMTIQVTQSIEDHAVKMHAAIDAQKLECLKQVNKAAERELETIQAKRSELESTLSDFQYGTDYVEQLLTYGKVDEVLASRSIVTDRMKHLSYTNIEAIDNTLKLYFTPGSSTQNLFGKVDLYVKPQADSEVAPIVQQDRKTVAPPPSLPTVGNEVELTLEFECKSPKDRKDIWPTGIDVDLEGNFIIVDRDNATAKVFNQSGSFLHQFGKAGDDRSRLISPFDLVVLQDGAVCITDYEHECIKVFTQDGALVDTIGVGDLKYPRGIAVNNKGHLVVTDCNQHRVTFHDPETGRLVRRIEGKTEEGAGRFTDPYYITTNKEGDVIVTDWAAPNIKIYNKSGECRTKYGTYGTRRDQILQPYGICTDEHGYMFVADNQNHRVHMLAPDGKFISFLVTKRNGLWHPMALCIAKRGHLAITEALGKVKVFKYI